KPCEARQWRSIGRRKLSVPESTGARSEGASGCWYRWGGLGFARGCLSDLDWMPRCPLFTGSPAAVLGAGRGNADARDLAVPDGITNPTPAGDVIVSSANAAMQVTAFEMR